MSEQRIRDDLEAWVEMGFPAWQVKETRTKMGTAKAFADWYIQKYVRPYPDNLAMWPTFGDAWITYRGVRKVRDNPTLAILGNPPKRLIQSRRVYSLSYQHASDRKDYKHDFAPGVDLYCLEDGALLLQRNDGKPLWEDFD